MTPQPGEQYWLGKHAERTPDRCRSARAPTRPRAHAPALPARRARGFRARGARRAVPEGRGLRRARARLRRSGGCKYYCDRQNLSLGFKTVEGGLSRPGHPHWDGSHGHYNITY